MEFRNTQMGKEMQGSGYLECTFLCRARVIMHLSLHRLCFTHRNTSLGRTTWWQLSIHFHHLCSVPRPCMEDRYFCYVLGPRPLRFREIKCSPGAIELTTCGPGQNADLRNAGPFPHPASGGSGLTVWSAPLMTGGIFMFMAKLQIKPLVAWAPTGKFAFSPSPAHFEVAHTLTSCAAQHI